MNKQRRWSQMRVQVDTDARIALSESKQYVKFQDTPRCRRRKSEHGFKKLQTERRVRAGGARG